MIKEFGIQVFLLVFPTVVHWKIILSTLVNLENSSKYFKHERTARADGTEMLKMT